MRLYSAVTGEGGGFRHPATLFYDGLTALFIVSAALAFAG
jgi:hypothetical protein